ncbi:Aldo/keto reductase [Microthyrium microscopicum]|uniref:Aldo/keto reductase n=1 Tax=Microthyrium microscopicum TaxID=703497 RepID=A0A6A6USN5_9PEZI|nr:Aldo/keto reductase [Microthyrium microscopicum]
MAKQPLKALLPPLIFGTATFTSQYNKDPYALDTTGLVRAALDHGIRAFDTSPYYGPAETLLGEGLAAARTEYPRNSYLLLTKVGRIAGDSFDYSAASVKASVKRSCERLHTDFLDVVYCHDVEFVSGAEVLEAIRALRELRNEGVIKFVGVSGYPVERLCEMAELVLKETGEPLDIVMSYANYTVQSERLASVGLERLKKAGVQVVPNASVLGMGLLRAGGAPVGSQGDWHPAPEGLRAVVAKAAEFCEDHGEKLEVVAIRWGIESWLKVGGEVGSYGRPGEDHTRGSATTLEGQESRLGVSVIGVSRHDELEKTMLVWHSILDGLEGGQAHADRAGRWERAHEWSLNRRHAVEMLAEEVRAILKEWADYAWASPPKGFVNTLNQK